MKSPHLASKSHIILGHPDLCQGLLVHIPQNVSAHLFLSAVDGEVAVIVRQGVTG